jgi:hypothetical protein
MGRLDVMLRESTIRKTLACIGLARMEDECLLDTNRPTNTNA